VVEETWNEVEHEQELVPNAVFVSASNANLQTKMDIWNRMNFETDKDVETDEDAENNEEVDIDDDVGMPRDIDGLRGDLE
jgi:hypothetical protein